MSRELKGTQRGQMLVIAALAMVVLMGFLAVAVDGSNAYAQHRLAQNAADAAALAGARELASGGVGPAVPAAIYEYATQRNRMDVSQWSYIDEGGEYVGVAVTTTTAFPTFFAGVMGYDSLTAYASAESKVGLRLGDDSGGTCGGYVIWADQWGGDDKEVYVKGENHTIVGDVHSNDDMKFGGKDHKISITETISYVDNFSDNSKDSVYSTPQQVSSQPWPVSYDITDYQPGGEMAVAAGANYHYTDGNLNLTCSSPQGLYYATGKITVNCTNMSGNVTIVAEGMIDIHQQTGNITLTPYSDGLLFFSNKSSASAIQMDGAGYTLSGIVYTPNGEIKIQAESLTLNGSMIGKRVEFTGGSKNGYFILTEEYCPTGSPGQPYLAR